MSPLSNQGDVQALPAADGVELCQELADFSSTCPSHSKQELAPSNLMPSDHPAAAPPLCRSVSFGGVEFRTHALCVGVNPSVSEGPPVSLDWTYDPKDDVRHDLEEYELARSPRRNWKELHMTISVRMQKLQEEGVSVGDICDAERGVRLAKRQRIETVQGLWLRPAEDALETILRRLKRVITRTSKKKELEKLWINAQSCEDAKKLKYYGDASFDTATTDSSTDSYDH